jgi:hypothetical protein
MVDSCNPLAFHPARNMKKVILSSIATIAFAHIAAAHGPGHMHRNQQPEINAALDTGAQTATPGQSEKSFDTPAIQEAEDIWGASISTGFESRHVHYGVDETGNTGAWTTEVGAWYGDFSVNVWSGFGLGTEFQEWDFTAAYNFDLGPVFLLPGYNLRYTPEIEEAHHHEEEEEDHHEEHSHNTYGNEAFIVLGTNQIPYVTPSVAWVWDFNNTNANSAGSFLEFRLDGDIPLYKDILSLQPYTLLGINFGYNTEDYDGWNNFQFGTEATWQLTPSIAIFGGLNYSIAMDALDTIGQGNVFWANAGISFTY